MTLMLLSLGEPIPRWCPKASNLGGLPNHAHEPSTPSPLGTMLKRALEFESGIIVHEVIVQNLEQQSRKKCSKEKTVF